MDASLLRQRPEKLLSDTDLDVYASQQEDCCHFSIRGYVSEVRKSDRKICWPFLEFQNPNDLDKHENVLPPLPVAEFKWWDCKQCLRKNSTAIEGSVEVPNGFLGTGNRMIQSGLLGPNDEHKFSKPSSLKEVIKHTSRTTSVFDVLGNDHIRTMSISVDNEVVHCQQKSEGQTTKPVDFISIVPYHEKSPKELNVLVKESRPICIVTSTEKTKTNSVNQFSNSSMKKSPYHGKFGYSFLGLKKCVQKDGGKKLNRTHVFAPKVILSDERKDSGSAKDDLIGSKTDVQYVNQHDSSNKCLNKKSQKTRTMDDILKSDVLGMAKKTPACDGQLSGVKLKNDSESKSNAFKDQKQNAIEDKEKSNKIIKTKKRQQISEIDDDEFPLMHWINRIPDKAKMVKLDGGTKFFDRSNIPKSTESVVPSGKQIVGGSNEGNKKVISQGKRQCRISDGESLQKDLMSHKRCTDGNFRKLDSRITVTNSARDLLAADKKGNMSKKQSTPPQGDDRECPPVHRAKVFLETSDNGKVAGSSLETINEKTSKEKSNQSDPEVVDGVPVEILKLLQENWLKRRSVNTECSNQRLVDLSEMNKEAAKDGKSLNLTRSNQDEVASSSVKIQHVENHNSRPCGVEEHEMSSSFMKIHDRHSSESGKAPENSCREYDFGIGKFHASNGSIESSYFREEGKSGVTLPLINSLENQCHHPNHKIGLPNADSYKFESSGYDLYRDYPHYQSYAVTSSMPSEMANSSDILLPGENFMGKPSQAVLLRKPRNMAFERGESATNSTAHLQNRSKKNLHVSNVSGFDLYKSTRTMSPSSLNLYKNDTYSAMHLLRLMDPAVSSSVPLCSSIDRRPQPDFSSFNQHRELFGAPPNLRSNQPFMHPAVATQENFGPSHHHHHRSHHHPGINSNISFEVQKHGASCLMDNTSPANYRLPFPLPYRNEYHSTAAQPLPLQKKNNPEVIMKSPNRNRANMMEFCVVNRNPADFTSPDESNEYMIGYDEPKLPLIYPNPKKRKQKAMKLTALKGLLRN